jgi:FlaA1/EpsC-like NDP-sugar epimerase
MKYFDIDLWHLRRPTKRALGQVLLHAAIFAFGLFFAFFTRNDFKFEGEWLETYSRCALWVVAIKVAVFYSLGQCHVSWRRMAFGDLTNLLWGATLSLLILVTIEAFLITTGRMVIWPRLPRSVILLDWGASIFLIGGIRAVWRSIQEELRPLLSKQARRSAIIVGADKAGELLARHLVSASKSPYYIVGFVDDDISKHHSVFAGFRVLGPLDRTALEVKRRGVNEVLVRSGDLSGKRFRKLYEECTSAGAEVKVIPAIDELLASQGEPSRIRLRPVEIRDLLRRDSVRLNYTAIRTFIEGRTVMVTGAGGSIGSEICRQVLRFKPQKLLLVERGENALFLLEQEFSAMPETPPCVPLIADVTDEQRIEQILKTHRPTIIFHAAAHKHVPMMERDPSEAIKNNCFGTRLLARLADRHGVHKFITISTDKAVNPTSVMGCSKLIAERYVQALSAGSQTKFIVVRFGNVLASNGSVVPIFQEQIRRGGPITVTHPDIERYFMTIPEASQLVLQAAAQGQGGEIFVLDMGESVKIVDLAHDLIALSGLEDDDIDIIFTGLRPGEKLYEELYFEEERRIKTSHPKLFCALHRPAELAEVEAVLAELATIIGEPASVVREKLRDLVPEFSIEASPIAKPRTAGPEGPES